MNTTIDDKAKELYNFFYDIIQSSDKYQYLLSDEEKEFSKKASIKCVDEMQSSFEKFLNRPLDNVYQDMKTPIGISEITEPYKHYLQKVKEKIQQL